MADRRQRAFSPDAFSSDAFSIEGGIARRWLRWQTLLWLVAAAALLWLRAGAIHWFSLGDTDDNMRMTQVRAWLGGQGWYDLRQYKLNPPVGFDMHWSRIVDLPIAALELIARPFVGAIAAEKFAAGVAPLLPLWVALVALGVIVRRLVDPRAWLASSALLLLSASTALLMFSPLRVDHHGWQLASLLWTVTGLVDRDRRRGGIVMGAASAFSLAIGLELIPFLAVAGAASVLRWVADDAERERLRGYGLALALGCTLGYLGFASHANRVPRCDVLSPVWLATMVLAGAGAFALSFVRDRCRVVRILLIAMLGIALAAFFALAFPQCLGRPEQVSDELARRWLDNIGEAKPLLSKGTDTILEIVALPVAGVLGSWWMLRRPTQRLDWAPIAALASVGLALVLWQVRVASAAQLLAIPGAVALLWTLVPALRAHRSPLVRVFGLVAAVLAFSGVGLTLAASKLPKPPKSAGDKATNRANALCWTMPALAPIARLPATTIFTQIDLGPRLIAVTHHKAIAGPYHRNGGAILDEMNAFGGTPDEARAIMTRHGATLLLICPKMNETTIYRTRDKGKFYDLLEGGRTFDWLTPVPLPAESPYRLWRIRPSGETISAS